MMVDLNSFGLEQIVRLNWVILLRHLEFRIYSEKCLDHTVVNTKLASTLNLKVIGQLNVPHQQSAKLYLTIP